MLTESVSYSAAFAAGLISFFSPCILPLIPAYFTFITGFSLEELTKNVSADVRKKVILSTAAYVSGFSLVFVLMGASASYLGAMIFDHRNAIRIIGGLLIIVLGVHMTGLVRFRALDVEKRLHLRNKPLHVFGTFVVGMAFAAGWSPCIGPLLGSILIIAGSQETIWQGMALLGTYSTGLALPFVLMSVFIHFLVRFISRATRILKFVNLTSGILLIVVGAILLADRLSWFTAIGQP
ncbi:MAG: cytochrome c biogenesis protein CcdA [Desulfobacterales bacterium]|nr:cytochrome c biogenesis protein CcdA [Desulfobacterales bacterium]